MESLIFLKGIVAGVLASIPLGPVGLICVQRTVNGGKSHGFVSGMGAASADTIYAAIAAFGLTFISDFVTSHELGFRLGGALVLIVFGMWYTRRKPEMKRTPKTGSTYLAHYFSTLAFTLTNPITIFAFIAMFSLLGLQKNGVINPANSSSMVIGVFTGACAWWLCLSFISARMRGHLLHPNFAIINRVIGVSVTLCGVVFAAFILLSCL